MSSSEKPSKECNTNWSARTGRGGGGRGLFLVSLSPQPKAQILRCLCRLEKFAFREELYFQRSESTTWLKQETAFYELNAKTVLCK